MSEPLPDPLARLLQIRFSREVCGDLAAAERREWWLANGRGGYAAGTVALSLTRRYLGREKYFSHCMTWAATT